MKGMNCFIGALALLPFLVEATNGQCTNGNNAAVFGFRRIGDQQPVGGVTVTVSPVTAPSGPCAVDGDFVVDFTFRNIVGSGVTKLSAIWFDDECAHPPGMSLMTLCQIIDDNSNGHIVNFSEVSTPHNPPNGGQLCPPFQTTMGFSADSDPGQVNAVDPGEFVTLRFVLNAGHTVNDVINCLSQADPNANPCVPGLRIAFNLDTPGGGASSSNVPNAFVGGDCDCDGIPDECEISCSGANGFCNNFPGCGGAADCNGDHIPDSCQPCANPPAAPASASAVPSSFCTGSAPATITLTANGGSGDVLRWYTASCGGTLVGTGSPLNLAAPGTTTTYFARWESNSCLCTSSTCASVTVSVTSSPATPVSPTATPSAICQGQTSNLSASVGAGVTVDWFSGSCGGTPVPGGASPVVSPSLTTTYFARARNTATACFSASCSSVTVTVGTAPAAPVSPTAAPNPICAGQSATLSATVPAGVTVDWFTGSCGGTLLPGGATPVVSPSAPTTYYARARNTTGNCSSATCASVTLTVNPTPAPPLAPTATPSTICQGESSTLSATVPDGLGVSIEWFTEVCGGTPVPGGASPVVSPLTTNTFFARARNISTGCNSTTCASVTVSVNASPATPVSPTATPSAVCQGQCSTLSASVPTGVTVEWFSESCGGTPVPGGASPSVCPASTTTYFARARNTMTDCVSTTCASVMVIVDTAPDAPVDPTATPNPVCEGQSSTLSAAVPAGVTVDWFTGSCDGTPVPGGATPVVSRSATTTYFARARNTTNNCSSATCASLTLTVNASPATPLTPTATPSTICQGQSSTLTATVPDGVSVEWFTESCGGTPVPGGASPVVSPLETATYFARARNTTTDCNSTNCASVTLNVNTAPATPLTPTATPETICQGQTSTLSASVPDGVTVEWFTDSCGGTPVPGGATPIVSPLATTTFFARARNTATECVSTTCASVMVTVDTAPDTPVSPSATPNPVCEGQSSTLSAEVPAGVTVDWFNGSCGGTPVPGGATPVVNPLATTTYYARARNTTSDCSGATCASLILAVNERPEEPVSASANPSHVCVPGGPLCTSLTAVLGPPNPLGNLGSGVVVEWFAGGCGNGALIGTGLSIQVCPTELTTYFARTRNTETDCSSTLCADTTVMVDAGPTAPTTVNSNPMEFCAGTQAAITLTAEGGTGTSLHWFDDSCGGNEIGTVTPLTIPAPSQTTTYYVRMEQEGCESSACTSVTVTVNPLPDPPTVTASSVEICLGGCTTLTATPGNGGDTLDWFESACDGGETPPLDGPSPQVCPTLTTTYFVRTRNSTTNCVGETCASIEVIVNPVPTSPVRASANPALVCEGACTILTAIVGPQRGTGITIDWFASGCGEGDPIGTGFSIQVCPMAATNYFARSRDTQTDCVSTSCAPVTVGVTPTPVAPTSVTSSPDGFCDGFDGNLTLTANGGIGETLHWFQGACGEGQDLGTANPLIVPAPTTPTTYCARWETATCPPSGCACLTITPGNCDDGNVCTIDTCDPESSVCVHTPIPNCCTQPADCDDGNLCTTDSCSDNQCVHTPIPNCCTQPADCDDGNLCTTDSCSDNQCVHTPISNCCTQPAACDDGNLCTTDSCSDNQCVHTPIPNCCTQPADCNDGNPCTTDSCSDNLCVHTPISGSNCCTQPADCDDGNLCTTDSCSENQCIHTPISNCCTQPADCNDGNPCTTDSCSDNLCVHTPIANCCQSDADCNDGNSCTADSCSDNQCIHTIVDSDGDDVPDCNDICPGTPAGQPVDTNGCSCSQRDSDHDSVNDCDDQCPNTPAGEAVNSVGCSCSQLDDDGDGVNNCNDLCPDSPPDQPVDTAGCPPPPVPSPCDPAQPKINILFSNGWLAPVCGTGCPIFIAGALCGLVTIRSRLRRWRCRRREISH